MTTRKWEIHMVHSKQQNSRTDKGQSMEGDLITKYTFMAYNNEIFTISNFAKTALYSKQF